MIFDESTMSAAEMSLPLLESVANCLHIEAILLLPAAKELDRAEPQRFAIRSSWLVDPYQYAVDGTNAMADTNR